ncbi:unnamed protein product [Closterium sp. NIES-53]
MLLALCTPHVPLSIVRLYRMCVPPHQAASRLPHRAHLFLVVLPQAPRHSSLLRTACTHPLGVLAPRRSPAGSPSTLVPANPLVRLHAARFHSPLRCAPRLSSSLPSPARHCLRRSARVLRALVLLYQPRKPSPARAFRAHLGARFGARLRLRLPARPLSWLLVGRILVHRPAPRLTALLAAPRLREHPPATSRLHALRRLLRRRRLLRAPLHAQHRTAACVLPPKFVRHCSLCSAHIVHSHSLRIVPQLSKRPRGTRLPPPLAAVLLAVAHPGLFPALRRRRRVIDALGPAVCGGRRRCAHHGLHAVRSHARSPPWLHLAGRRTRSASARAG